VSRFSRSALFVFLASNGVVNAGLISVNFTNGDLPRDILPSDSTDVVDTADWQNISASTSDIGSTAVDVTLEGMIHTANTARDFTDSDGTNGFLAVYEAGLRDSTMGS